MPSSWWHSHIYSMVTFTNRSVTGCSREVAHLLGGHLAAEDSGGGEVAAVAGVGGAHHVL